MDEALPFNQLLLELKRDQLAWRIKLGRLDKEQTGAMLATLFAEEITPEFLEDRYRPESVKEIIMMDFLEHQTRFEAVRLLQSCFKIMDNDASISIQVPNVDGICKME